MSKREFIRYSQMINNGKFRLLAVATDTIQMDGFTVKPGMMIYQATNKGHRDIFFVAYPGPSPMYIHGRMVGPSVKGAMIRKEQLEAIEDASEEARSILDKVAYLSACKEADGHDPESLATLEGEVQLTFQPGYSECMYNISLKPTEHPGVFWRTTCSVLTDVTDYDGGEYAVYTKAELDSAIKKSAASMAAVSCSDDDDDDDE